MMNTAQDVGARIPEGYEIDPEIYETLPVGTDLSDDEPEVL